MTIVSEKPSFYLIKYILTILIIEKTDRQNMNSSPPATKTNGPIRNNGNQQPSAGKAIHAHVNLFYNTRSDRKRSQMTSFH